jgi:hypothetical protein
MPLIQFANNAQSTLASGITSGVTSLTVATGQGARFPTLTAGQYCYATLATADEATLEVVKVTARAGDVFTVVRGQEGTTASAFLAGATVELRLTAAGLGAVLSETVSPLDSRLTALEGATSPTASGTYLVAGGTVAWVNGLTFRIGAATYYIDGTLYTSAEANVTLTAADPTLDRIDLLILTASGAAKATGTAAAQAFEPTLDPASQLRVTAVTVPAAASAVSVTVETVYAEAAGGEWTATASAGTITLASTTSPRSGTKCVSGTGVAAGTYVEFTRATAETLEGRSLVCYLDPVSAWGTKKGIRLALYSGTTLKGTQIAIASGQYGFNSQATGYQQLVVPATAFALPAGTTCDKLRVEFTGSGTNVAFRLDDVQWQSATTQAATGGTLPAGGAAGQVLKKQSSANYDAAFATLTEADIQGLVADLAAKLPTAGGTISGNLIITGITTVDGMRYATITKTTAYTLTTTDETVIVDATSASVNITLPSASANPGQLYTIVKKDATTNSVNLVASGGALVNGTASYALTTQYAQISVQSDGTNWYIVTPTATTFVNPIQTKGDLIAGTQPTLADLSKSTFTATYDGLVTSAANVLDGNTGTTYITGSNPNNHYFVIDTGVVTSVGGVRIHQGVFLPPYVHWASQIRVDYSNNGTSWTTHYTSGTIADGGDSGNLDFTAGVAAARYWRVFALANTGSWSSWYMNEITLRGPTGSFTIRLPVGTTDGDALTADSTATTGLSYGGVKSIKEAGGQKLTIGAISDGQQLQRSGTTLIGVTPASGGGGALVNGPATTDYVVTRRTAAQTITTGTWTALSWSDAPQNPSALWASGSPTRVTAQKTGLYMLGATANFTTSNCEHYIRFKKNGASVQPVNELVGHDPASTFAQARVHVAQSMYLSVGDYVEVEVFHNLGSNLTIAADQEYAQCWGFLVQGGGGAEVLITETALSGTAASVPFSSIPATYRDLRIVVRGRSDAAGVNNVDLRMQFNGDTGANYDSVFTINNNSNTFFNGEIIAGTYGYMGQVSAATAPAGVPGVSEIRVYDYRGTTWNKEWQAHCATKRAASTGNLFNFHTSGQWRSTAAITSLTVLPSAGNFIAGTVVSLYGIL